MLKSWFSPTKSSDKSLPSPHKKEYRKNFNVIFLLIKRLNYAKRIYYELT